MYTLPSAYLSVFVLRKCVGYSVHIRVYYTPSAGVMQMEFSISVTGRRTGSAFAYRVLRKRNEVNGLYSEG